MEVIQRASPQRLRARRVVTWGAGCSLNDSFLRFVDKGFVAKTLTYVSSGSDFIAMAFLIAGQLTHLPVNPLLKARD